MKAVICGALIALLTTSANAAVQDLLTSAKYIMPGCKAFLEKGNNTDLMKQGFCMGIVVGLSSMQLLKKERQEGKVAVQYCFDMPEAESGIPDQAIKAIVKYADLHTEQLEYSFVRVALTALQEAWPCKD
jgi:hypothetical protein